jgi:hypothetical protein
VKGWVQISQEVQEIGILFMTYLIVNEQ